MDIAIIDDDESVRESTRALLRSEGYQASTFASAEQFLNSDDIEEIKCLILDIRMPGMDGLELQRRLVDIGTPVRIIFLTAHDDARNRRRAIDGGALAFLSKPFEANILVAAVQSAFPVQP